MTKSPRLAGADEDVVSPPARPPAGPPAGQAVAVWRFDALGETLEVACHDERVAEALAPLLAAHPRSRSRPGPPLRRLG